MRAPLLGCLAAPAAKSKPLCTSSAPRVRTWCCAAERSHPANRPAEPHTQRAQCVADPCKQREGVTTRLGGGCLESQSPLPLPQCAGEEKYALPVPPPRACQWGVAVAQAPRSASQTCQTAAVPLPASSLPSTTSTVAAGAAPSPSPRVSPARQGRMRNKEQKRLSMCDGGKQHKTRCRCRPKVL